jgi:hypothetical protein
MAYKETVRRLHLAPADPKEPAYESQTKANVQNLAGALLEAAAHQAWSGQEKEYATTCRFALEPGTSSDDPPTMERGAKACVLRPGSDPGRLSKSLALARKAVDLGKGHAFEHFFLMTLGMAEFRSGHWAEAETAFVAASQNESDTSAIWLTSAFYRGMTLFRQGKRDEARKLVGEAEARMKPLPDASDENLNPNDLIVWMAYKETRELLKLPSAAPPGRSGAN